MFQFQLPYREAIKIAKKLAHSVAKEEHRRWSLQGFYLTREQDGNHYAISTDGRKLTKIKINPVYGEEGAIMKLPFPAMIFPAVALKQIEQIKLASSDKSRRFVMFKIDNLDYRIELDDLVFVGRLHGGEYPDYQRIVPDYKSFTNQYGTEGFSPVYLAEIMKAASYDAEQFKATATPVRFFFEAGNAGVILEERDPDILYVVYPMRARGFPEHKHEQAGQPAA